MCETGLALPADATAMFLSVLFAHATVMQNKSLFIYIYIYIYILMYALMYV